MLKGKVASNQELTGSVKLSKIIKGEKGDRGEKGEPGAVPERGIDYWTPTDREEVVAEALDNLQPDIDRIERIAKGRATGYVFDTTADMETWLSVPENVEKLTQGDNLYIRQLSVPDWWWDGTQPQQLETQKVDLSEYAKVEDLEELDQVFIVEYGAATFNDVKDAVDSGKIVFVYYDKFVYHLIRKDVQQITFCRTYIEATAQQLVSETVNVDFRDRWTINSKHDFVTRADIEKIVGKPYTLTWVNGEYVNRINGQFLPDTSWKRTDYTEVKSASIFLKSDRRSVYNCFYDADQNYISGFEVSIGESEITAPANAKYFVLSNLIVADISVRQTQDQGMLGDFAKQEDLETLENQVAQLQEIVEGLIS